MLSCGNKNKVQDDSLEWECLDSIHKVQQKEYEAKETGMSQDPDKHSPVSSSSSGGYSSNDDEEKEYDNMRGFDIRYRERNNEAVDIQLCRRLLVFFSSSRLNILGLLHTI